MQAAPGAKPIYPNSPWRYGIGEKRDSRVHSQGRPVVSRDSGKTWGIWKPQRRQLAFRVALS